MEEMFWVVKHRLKNMPREHIEWEEGVVESTHITMNGALQEAKNILARIPHNDGKQEDFDRICAIKTISVEVVERIVTDTTIERTYMAKE